MPQLGIKDVSGRAGGGRSVISLADAAIAGTSATEWRSWRYKITELWFLILFQGSLDDLVYESLQGFYVLDR